MNNPLYEFGGTADVLITCKTKRTIGTTEYDANEPYTLLKDVEIGFEYDQNSKNANASKPVFSSQNAYPSSLSIYGVPLNKKVADLIFTTKTANYAKTHKEQIFCDTNGQLILSQAPVNNEIFCYNEQLDKITITEVAEDHVVGDFISGEKYLVFYKVAQAGNIYSLDVPYYAYFSIEIFVKGNKDKIAGNLYMKFDAASLQTVPNLNIVDGGLLNTPLVFDLIYKNQGEPFIVF